MNRMELRQLRYFIRIVDLGSLSRASADLYIAQPALSQQLASLESELGVRLLARSSRGIAPTQAGVSFYKHAQTVLRQIDRLRSEVSSTATGPSGTVSIGMPPSIANVLAVPLTRAAQERYPQVQLRIREALTGQLEELVANGRIEMSLLFDRGPGLGESNAARKGPIAHLNVEPLLTEELVLLTAGLQPWGDDIDLSDAASHKFILFPGPTNVTRQMIQEVWDQAGYTLNIFAELDSTTTIKAMVANGLGSTILSPSALSTTQREGLTARRISGVDLTRRVCLCTNSVFTVGDAAERIFSLVVEIAQNLAGNGMWRGACAAKAE